MRILWNILIVSVLSRSGEDNEHFMVVWVEVGTSICVWSYRFTTNYMYFVAFRAYGLQGKIPGKMHPERVLFSTSQLTQSITILSILITNVNI